MLVKFSCGCVGTPPIDGKSIILDNCDRDKDDDGELHFFQRNMTDNNGQVKSFEPLPPEKVQEYTQRLWDYLRDARRWRSARSLFKQLTQD